jgi:K+-sensing histidine kinase KdpD
MESTPGNSLPAAAAGAGVSILVAAALVPLRTTLGASNIALLLVLVVVLAAVAGGRLGGALTGVTAGLSFNFFFTRPYLTMRVNDRRDITTIVLIVVLGLIVGQVTSVLARHRVTHTSQKQALHGLEAAVAMASSGAGPNEVWATIREELTDGFGLTGAEFRRNDPEALPIIDRNGTFAGKRHHFTGTGFALPPAGLQVPVILDGAQLGQIVLTGPATTSVTIEQRRAIVAMADQLAMSHRRDAAHLDPAHLDPALRVGPDPAP